MYDDDDKGSSSDTRYPLIHFFVFFLSFIFLRGRRGGREAGRRGGGEEGRRGGGEGRRGAGEREVGGEDGLERQSLLCWYLCYLCSSESLQEANKQCILRM